MEEGVALGEGLAAGEAVPAPPQREGVVEPEREGVRLPEGEAVDEREAGGAPVPATGLLFAEAQSESDRVGEGVPEAEAQGEREGAPLPEGDNEAVMLGLRVSLGAAFHPHHNSQRQLHPVVGLQLPVPLPHVLAEGQALPMG